MGVKSRLQDNPLRGGVRMAKPPDPVSIVIFGASGDLTARKLIPALYSLAQGSLPANQFDIFGYARRQWSDGDFRAEMKAAMENFARTRPETKGLWESFANSISFVKGNFDISNDNVELD